MQADVLSGDRLDFPVQLDGVGLQARDSGIAVERMESAGRVPARARGQLLALEQRHLAAAKLREVVEHAAADHAAADDGDLYVRFHDSTPESRRRAY